MNDNKDLETLERGAYRESYSDGIIDIFVGVSLVWLGVAFIWLRDYAGLAGILPAVFITPVLAGRKRFVESRGGYVKWSQTRRKWERRNLAVALSAGVVLLMIGVGVFVVVTQSSVDTNALGVLGPGLMAWLLALGALVLGFLMATWRMFAYAAVLAVGGVLTVWADARPGWPLLAAGIVVTVTGTVMLARFLRHNPVIETP